MSDEPHDRGWEATRQDATQTTRQPPPAPPYPQANRPPPAPPYQESRQAHRVELHRPYATGIILGFGIMTAGLIVSVVLAIVLTVFGIGLAGMFSGTTGLN